MAVPYIFSTVPGGSSIPLAELDSNFAYITSGNPVFLGLTLTGNLSVGGATTFTGPVTANDLAVNGSLTIDGTTINPTGITGTGLLVFNTNPTLVTPILGTPASGNLANCTNLPVNQVAGLATGILPFLTNPTTANLGAAVVDETGTGNLVLSNNPTLTSPTFVAPILGTPASGNLSSCTGYPAPNLSGVVPIVNGGTGLSATGTVGQILGVTAVNTLGYISAPPSVSIAGGAPSQLLYQSAPNVTNFIPNGTLGQVLLSNGAGVPSWGQVDLTTGVTNVLPIARGGTNSSTRQQAMDTLAGANTLGQYLRGNGTNVVMSAIQASDVPTLNQNTTGSAATFTSTTQSSQFNAIGVNVAPTAVPGSVTITNYYTDANGTLHPIVLGTSVAASGSIISFGAIPSWVNRITVMFASVTHVGGGANPQIQLGTAGGLETTGYTSSATDITLASTSSTTGFVTTSNAGGQSLNTYWTINKITGNQWICSHNGTLNNSQWIVGTGIKTLAGQLTQLAITFTGADTYNGGTVNIMYE
jgi:hypothetical protein